MTPLTSRLAAIVAECERVIENAKDATPGPWREGTQNVWNDDLLIPVVEMRHRISKAYGASHPTVSSDDLRWPQNDADFIAHTRTVAPKMARALLLIIGRWKHDVWLYAGMQRGRDADRELQQLADEWEEMK